MNVRLFKPSLGQEELDAVKEVFDISWVGLGGKVTEFEEAWSAYIGCAQTIALNSCTAALHLALAAFRFPEGKKVLVPAMTFASTAMAIAYNRLEPVFVDCDLETFGIDFNDLERKVDKDCVAVMPVHFGGHPVPMDRLMEFAAHHKLKVVEDCAHTQGGEYKGRKLGTWGDFGCFSFEEKKGMTTGDGGALCSNDIDLLDAIRPMRWVGMDKDTWKRREAYTDVDSDARHWFYEINDIGYKYNMNNLAATIGLVQLKKLPAMNVAKERAIARYLEHLPDSIGMKPLLPYILDGKSAYWLFGIRCERRDALIVHLKKRGIATGVHYTPLCNHPYWRAYASLIPHADKAYHEIVTLPLFPDISDVEIDEVVAALNGR